MSASARISPRPIPAHLRARSPGPGRPAASGRPAAGATGSRRFSPSNAGPNAAATFPSPEGLDLPHHPATRPPSARLAPSLRGILPGIGRRSRAVLTTPRPGGQCLGREEPSAAVGHAHEGFAIDGRLEPEPEQPRIPLAEKAVDVRCHKRSPSPGPGSSRWNVTAASSSR